MVFQDPTLSFNPKMNIRDIVCEPLMNFKKIKKSEKDTVCRKLLEMVELPGDFADRYPHKDEWWTAPACCNCESTGTGTGDRCSG